MTDNVDEVIFQIVWYPRSVNSRLQGHNEHVTKILCSLGRVEKWHDHTQEGVSIHVPRFFNIEGIAVEFLPANWSQYNVGGIWIDLPQTVRDIRKAVAAVKMLQGLGMRLRRSDLI